MNPEIRTRNMVVTQKKMQKYKEFLEFVLSNGWWILPVGVMNECDETDKVLGILHSVQGQVEIVKEVGILEKLLGVFTSFALPPVDLDLYKFIVALSHEPLANFSIFSKDISLYSKFSTSPSSILRNTLNFYHDWQPDGIVLPFNDMLNHVNMEEASYFTEYGSEKELIINLQDGQQVRFLMGIHPLQEFGLTYVFSKLREKTYSDNTPEDMEELLEVIKTGNSKTVCSINPQLWGNS